MMTVGIYYPKPFDVTKPPPAPPLVEFTMWPFAGRVETKASKIKTAEYKYRLNEYGRNLEIAKRKKDRNYIGGPDIPKGPEPVEGY